MRAVANTADVARACLREGFAMLPQLPSSAGNCVVPTIRGSGSGLPPDCRSRSAAATDMMWTLRAE